MLKKISSFIKQSYPVLGFIVFYFFLLADKIIRHPSPFFDWDESIYAQVGREMIRQKSFIVPLWQGMPWLDKPPVPSLFYGLIQLIPAPPEISTRLATLGLSCVALVLLYLLARRITKDTLVSFLTVVLTAFLPIYFQRSTALNVDVFLLVGWLGYTLWYERTTRSTYFLILAVLSKSLLGFFPPLMFLLYFVYRFFMKQITLRVLMTEFRKIMVQIGVSSIWFILMLIFYRYPFIQYQFIDSHFKRVASSIEQHFGQRTFYVTVLIDQFKLLLIPALVSCVFLVYQFFKNRSKDYPFFLGLFFIPWFAFLNLTKTKIEWYIYPVLPQFAFLASYPLAFFRRQRAVRIVLFAMIAGLFFLSVTPVSMLVTQPFSSWEDHQYIALDAKKAGCSDLEVLVGKDTRTSYATLKSMDLVISTTKWWGNHPSIAYYADTKTTYLYEVKEAERVFAKPVKNGCLIVEKKDMALFPQTEAMSEVPATNKTYLLFKAK